MGLLFIGMFFGNISHMVPSFAYVLSLPGVSGCYVRTLAGWLSSTGVLQLQATRA
jgi:hypothetical protein